MQRPVRSIEYIWPKTFRPSDPERIVHRVRFYMLRSSLGAERIWGMAFTMA